jgi:alpha-ketoglutarate-dependent 2,4-dichlorophenoxyacetate dioxygenase
MPEGRLLLRDLMDHATQRRFTYAHKWQVGDLVVWDNRCTLHRGRPYEDRKHKRDLRRVTTQDVESVGDNPELVREMGLLAS